MGEVLFKWFGNYLTDISVKQSLKAHFIILLYFFYLYSFIILLYFRKNFTLNFFFKIYWKL